MSISEVFPNPTVKQVIFQIRFPNLFYIGNKIGDYQMKIMEKFPESKLVQRQKFIIAETDSGDDFEKIYDKSGGSEQQIIWKFNSNNGVELNVQSGSIDLSSSHHKTYNNESANNEDRFREIIKYSIDNFLQVVSIPIISRIGLRYIDECFVPGVDNEGYGSFYNSTFALDRFPIEKTIQSDFRTTQRIGDYKVMFREYFQNVNDEPKLILDFDGFAENIKTEDYLAKLDDLHDLIIAEYEKSLKQPALDYMREKKVQ